MFFFVVVSVHHHLRANAKTAIVPKNPDQTGARIGEEIFRQTRHVCWREENLTETNS